MAEHVAPLIGDQLQPTACLLLTEDRDIRQSIAKLNHFIRTYNHISSSHCVDFFTRNLFTSLLMEEWREQLAHMTYGQLTTLPMVTDDTLFSTKGDLNHFLKQSKELRLQEKPCEQHCGVSVSEKDMLAGGYGEGEQSYCCMKRKKCHEVEKMAPWISKLAEECGARQVLDLGSGKGYLSEVLASQYHFVVAGVDGSDTHTEEAKKRVQKLHHSKQKVFPEKENLKHSSEDLQSSKVPSQQHSPSPQLSSSTSIVASKCLCPSENDAECLHSLCGSNSHSNFFSEHPSPSLHCNSLSTMCTEPPQDMSSDTNSLFLSGSSDKSHIDTRSYSPNTESQSESIETTLTKSSAVSYSPITMHLTLDVSSHQLLQAVSAQSRGVFKSDRPTVLVGLHTCGDLACIGLRLFIEVKQFTGLCVVGCCYNHITEEGCVTGFPLSKFLRATDITLGRNARMLANQSPERLITKEMDSSSHNDALESIFYRAVLQVILVNEFNVPKDSRDYCVGKVYSKCKKKGGFVPYVQECLKKLGIENTLSEDGINSYLRKYEYQKIEMYAFHQIRACIAPCIEALIILDRLLYLRENGIHDSRIIAMFNQVTSPRAYAIIARKH